MPSKKTTKGSTRKRESSEDSDHHKGSKKLKFEDFDVEAALKQAAPPTPPPPAPAPPVEPVALPANGTTEAPEESEVVALAAVTRVAVDRVAESTHGLLKEPDPPEKDIPRVTREGAAPPPIPSDLLQLLSG
ncbi:hypothetical protein ADEAN_000170800 [Angomonas deanei]|uniref:Uncharacterized protein n=1 Tax=Angomonas deanei TaxID=59799 RepID=A0A7G2C650_9TRYP|nr:hypothetical protein ADEAN_000170800 [Angomonas deanei]